MSDCQTGLFLLSFYAQNPFETRIVSPCWLPSPLFLLLLSLAVIWSILMEMGLSDTLCPMNSLFWISSDQSGDQSCAYSINLKMFFFLNLIIKSLPAATDCVFFDTVAWFKTLSVTLLLAKIKPWLSASLWICVRVSVIRCRTKSEANDDWSG